MKHYIVVYFCTLVVMCILDFTWIGVVASNFYKSRISNLEFHAVPGVLFYLTYCAGIVVFVNGGVNLRWQSVALTGALFGFFAYATYDLTNLATLRGWSVTLAAVDIAWGCFVTAFAASAGAIITRYFEGA